MTQERLLHGWDNVNKEWVKLQVDANGYVKVDLSSINLNDLADLDAAAPDDEDVLTWDDALSKWVPAVSATVASVTNLYKKLMQLQNNLLSQENWSFEDTDGGCVSLNVATISHVTDEAKYGAYSLKLTTNGTNWGGGEFSLSVDLYGLVVVVGCWFKCSSASRVFIMIYTGTDDVAGAYHSGGGAWEWLTCTATIAGSGSPKAQLRATEGANITWYCDGIIINKNASTLVEP